MDNIFFPIRSALAPLHFAMNLLCFRIYITRQGILLLGMITF